jgi:hypothetical protein
MSCHMNSNTRSSLAAHDPSAVHVFVPAGGGAATVAPATPLRASLINVPKKETKTAAGDEAKMEEGRPDII